MTLVRSMTSRKYHSALVRCTLSSGSALSRESSLQFRLRGRVDVSLADQVVVSWTPARARHVVLELLAQILPEWIRRAPARVPLALTDGSSLIIVSAGSSLDVLFTRN